LGVSAAALPKAAWSASAAVYKSLLSYEDSNSGTILDPQNFTASSTLPSPVSLSTGAVSGSVSFNSPGSNPAILASSSVLSGAYCSPNICAVPANEFDSVGYIQYYFTIVAPNGTTPASIVPIVVAGSTTLLNSNGYMAASDILVGTLSANVGSQQWFCGNGYQGIDGSCGTFAYKIAGTVSSFTAASISSNPSLYSGSIYMQEEANAAGSLYLCGSPSGYNCTQASSVSASIDPYISIDPTFLSANPGYSIVVSDGFSNNPLATSSAPEPASWMCGGIGGILLAGLSLRRRRIRASNLI
jgi:hypothetical protein